MNAMHATPHLQITINSQSTPVSHPSAGFTRKLRRLLSALATLRQRRAVMADEAARHRVRQVHSRNQARLEQGGYRFDRRGDDIFARAER